MNRAQTIERENEMRRILVTVVIAGMCVALGSCAAEQKYMGKWGGSADDTKVVVELLENDVFIVHVNDEQHAGEWEVDSEGQLRAELKDTKLVGKMLDKKRLLISEEDGDQAVVFERVK